MPPKTTLYSTFSISVNSFVFISFLFLSQDPSFVTNPEVRWWLQDLKTPTKNQLYVTTTSLPFRQDLEAQCKTNLFHLLLTFDQYTFTCLPLNSVSQSISFNGKKWFCYALKRKQDTVEHLKVTTQRSVCGRSSRQHIWNEVFWEECEVNNGWSWGVFRERWANFKFHRKQLHTRRCRVKFKIS